MTQPQVRPFLDDDEAAVIALWTACGLVRPWNDPRVDIARKKRNGDDLFLVAMAEMSLVGTVMGGYDGHRGWVNYLAVDSDWQRRGVARLLMEEVERRLRAAGCPKLNLQVREGNDRALHFYEAIGYSRDEVVSYGKRLIEDASPPGHT